MTDARPWSPEIRASARGVVTELELRRNSRGQPWVTVTLATAGGALRCVCFPRSLPTLTTPPVLDAHVVVQGQVSGVGGDFRILDAVPDVRTRCGEV